MCYCALCVSVLDIFSTLLNNLHVSSRTSRKSSEFAQSSSAQNIMSSSLLVKLLETDFDNDINSFVFPDMAETTTIILFPRSDSFLMIFAACIILSIEPSEVPPNFSTFFLMPIVACSPGRVKAKQEYILEGSKEKVRQLIGGIQQRLGLFNFSWYINSG